MPLPRICISSSRIRGGRYRKSAILSRRALLACLRRYPSGAGSPDRPRSGERGLRAEVLALRHQLRVLERQSGRPRWQPCDRLLLAAISRILTRPAWRSLLPGPETLLRWHRGAGPSEMGRLSETTAPPSVNSKQRAPQTHPPPGWRELEVGYRRIQGELLKFGHRCSHLTVRRVLRRHGLPPASRRGQRTWREFVRQHADQILAVDFFVVDTVWLTQLCVLFWIEVGSRRVHLAGCTYSPSGAWVVRRRGTWPGSCMTLSWVPGSYSVIATPSSAPPSTRSSGARAWRSSACLTGRLGRTHLRNGLWGQPGESVSITCCSSAAGTLRGSCRSSSSTTTRLGRTKASGSGRPADRPM